MIWVMGLDTNSDYGWGFTGINYLLAVGIDTYKYWPPLENPVKDVEDFTSILLERYQFQKDHVLVLKNRQATEIKILDKLYELIKNVKDKDNLIIYYSGHGHYDQVTEEGYWIPVNAKKGVPTEYIDTFKIVNRVKKINSLHTFLIIDSCFSGNLIHDITTNRGEASGAERFKSRVVLTSGAKDEVVPDGPPGQNSPFAQGLINSLKNNIKTHLSVAQLIIDVKNHVLNQSKQTPMAYVLANSEDKGGDYVFHLKRGEDEIWSQVTQTNTVEVYKKFMDQFPNSVHFQEAGDAYEWLIACKKDTVGSYQQYINAYKHMNGKHVSEAIKRQRALDGNAHWERTKERDTVSGYNEFMFKFPESPHVEDAERRIYEMRGTPLRTGDGMGPNPSPDNLNETKKWEEAKQWNTYVGFLNFITGFPNSEYSDQAKLKMKIMEYSAYNEIKLIREYDTYTLKQKIDACYQYFRDYPGGKHFNSVKKIKDEMESKK